MITKTTCTVSQLVILNLFILFFYFVDVTTPEEQEQVFVASVHNLAKVAAIFLKEIMHS